jgi:DNA-binding PucR family transcriptional regulator
VRYRLNQIEALMEHPIDQRRAQVELALRCVAEFGARTFR